MGKYLASSTGPGYATKATKATKAPPALGDSAPLVALVA